MFVDERVTNALDLRLINPPSSLKVLRIEPEEYTDWSGEEAIQVNVIISDEVDEFQFNGEDIAALYRSIHDRLLEHGVKEFPYISLYKESEFTDEQAED